MINYSFLSYKAFNFIRRSIFLVVVNYCSTKMSRVLLDIQNQQRNNRKRNFALNYIIKLVKFNRLKDFITTKR